MILISSVHGSASLWGNLTRGSPYPVAELQRKLTTIWSDITSTRTCSCWRSATRGSIRILAANVIRTRRAIPVIRAILPLRPDTTSPSSSYLILHHCRTHPSPTPRMHTLTFTTIVTREPNQRRKKSTFDRVNIYRLSWRGLVIWTKRISKISCLTIIVKWTAKFLVYRTWRFLYNLPVTGLLIVRRFIEHRGATCLIFSEDSGRIMKDHYHGIIEFSTSKKNLIIVSE